MTQLESLLEERKALEKDFKKFGDELNDWSHDLFTSRFEMLDSMIEIEEQVNA
jgi:hypothetical protein